MIEYIQFFPTLKCNKNCDFRYSRALFYNDLSENKIEQLIDFSYENRIKNLDILGGEPFLYEHLHILIKKSLVIDLEITIRTNGTLTNEIRDFLKNLNNKKVKIGVSINGSSSNDLIETVNDSNRRFWSQKFRIFSKKTKTIYAIVNYASSTQNTEADALLTASFITESIENPIL